ncbi:pectinesterase inhibitor domain-containing protein [Artemisia annua]|uniref:Pectinesterase inhibitor domain-containing protein n=1 Tax=Artemisia annua TaxID=35608 RepID=A0A2U1PCJ1_ARTAN|nr:pectinesterase inhibitor domain-containing protein [Artemisia annua]
MDQTNFFSLFFLTFITMAFVLAPVSSTTTSTTKKNTNFVKTSCNVTTYPSVCLTSLLPYASAVKSNPIRLVKQALSVTLKASSTTRSMISTLAKAKNITKGDAAVLKDCIVDIQDSISEIKDSLKAISSLKSSADKKFVLSNAETWTSAALSDEYSCTDGMEDEEVSPAVKKKIKTSVFSIARLSSNALYLINHLNI